MKSVFRHLMGRKMEQSLLQSGPSKTIGSSSIPNELERSQGSTTGVLARVVTPCC